MVVAVKNIGEELKYVDSKEKYRDDCAKEFVGKNSTIQFVPISPDRLFGLAVDEDGLPKRLPTNFLLPMQSPYFPIQKMVGNVVFIRRKPVEGWGEIWDYEVDDLTESDKEVIEHILSEQFQQPLEEQFVDYKNGKMHIVKL